VNTRQIGGEVNSRKVGLVISVVLVFRGGQVVVIDGYLVMAVVYSWISTLVVE
jgi:hypothetical protein